MLLEGLGGRLLLAPPFLALSHSCDSLCFHCIPYLQCLCFRIVLLHLHSTNPCALACMRVFHIAPPALVPHTADAIHITSSPVHCPTVMSTPLS